MLGLRARGRAAKPMRPVPRFRTCGAKRTANILHSTKIPLLRFLSWLALKFRWAQESSGKPAEIANAGVRRGVVACCQCDESSEDLLVPGRTVLSLRSRYRRRSTRRAV